MRLSLLATLALVTAALPALAPAASAEAEPCVEYMYVADYHWYYACVDPKGGTCAVYTKERHGMTWSKHCLVEKEGAPLDAPSATCIPTSGGMDYPSYLCVDTSNPKCAVYTLTSSDWGTQKKCYGVVAAAGIPTPLSDHDRDGDMEAGPVCVWGFGDECVLAAYECFQPYRPGFGINCI